MNALPADPPPAEPPGSTVREYLADMRAEVDAQHRALDALAARLDAVEDHVNHLHSHRVD